jgi:hypothetical protein
MVAVVCRSESPQGGPEALLRRIYRVLTYRACRSSLSPGSTAATELKNADTVADEELRRVYALFVRFPIARNALTLKRLE